MTIWTFLKDSITESQTQSLLFQTSLDIVQNKKIYIEQRLVDDPRKNTFDGFLTHHFLRMLGALLRCHGAPEHKPQYKYTDTVMH